jgi:hypothetical protein
MATRSRLPNRRYLSIDAISSKLLSISAKAGRAGEVYREGLCLFAKPYRLTQKYPFSDKTHTSADFRVPADSKL